MRTVDVGGNTYKIGKMNVFVQLHVGRRLAPLLFHFYSSLRAASPDAIKSLRALTSTDESDVRDAQTAALSSAIIEPIAEAVSKLSDVDFNFVVNSCLAVVERKQENGWASIAAAGANGTLMFQDITAPDVLGLTVQTVLENLGSFFPTAGQP